MRTRKGETSNKRHDGRRRILFMLPRFHANVFPLVSALEAQGFIVRVLTTRREPGEPSWPGLERVEPRRGAAGHRFSPRPFAAGRAVLRWGPDVVVIRNPDLFLVPLLLALRVVGRRVLLSTQS